MYVHTYTTDADECANSSTNDCTQQCINTPGSYECDCYDGYQPITPNATQCVGKVLATLLPELLNYYT